MDNNEFKETLGRNIKRRMDAMSLSQNDVARALGVSQSIVSDWINGRKEPRIGKLDAMCEMFHCTRSFLMGVDGRSTRDELLDAAFFDRPDMRQLFSVAEDATAEEIAQAIKIIEALKKQ